MEKELTPFGYRYIGDICSIKLRLKGDKFMAAGLNKYGNFRYTNKGYIIFEIQLNVRSEEFKEVSSKLNSLRTSQ